MLLFSLFFVCCSLVWLTVLPLMLDRHIRIAISKLCVQRHSPIAINYMHGMLKELISNDLAGAHIIYICSVYI